MELEDLIMIAASNLYKKCSNPLHVIDSDGKVHKMNSYEEAVYHARKLWEAVVADKFNPDGTININKYDEEV